MTPEQQDEQLAAIRWGMDVFDSEHHKIGVVDKVYRGADYGTPPPPAAPTIVEPYLKVDAGQADLFVPTSSISAVSPDGVVLNVLARRIDGMGWDQKPEFLQG